MLKKTTTLLLLPIILSGCATIFTGTSQNINIQAVSSKDNETLKGVRCTIRDGEGTIYAVPSNPGSISIRKGKGSLTPKCRKTGYKQITYGVGENFNAITFVNVLFWPGFIVDAVTGSMNKYPSHIAVLMEPIKGKQ